MPIPKEFNKDFFKKWSSNMAYILGFLFADGNIVKTKRGTHFVSFYTADRALLYQMRDVIGSNHKIGERKSKEGKVYVLQIGSFELFNDIKKYGLVPHKAHRMMLPIIPSQYEGDFIRGYFDGDGNIWKGFVNKNRHKKTEVLQVCFTSVSYDFLFNLLNVIKNKGIIGGSLFKSKKKNFSRLCFSTLDSLKFYQIMYNEPTKLFLPRKKLIFEKFIQMRP